MNRRSLFRWTLGLFLSGPLAKLLPMKANAHWTPMFFDYWSDWDNTVGTTPLTFESLWDLIEDLKREQTQMIGDTSFGDSFRD